MPTGDKVRWFAPLRQHREHEEYPLHSEERQDEALEWQEENLPVIY